MKHQKLVTLPEVSKRMSQVRLKRGIAEVNLAKALWHRGIRYRLNYRALSGSPDIAITKHKIAVFVDGEFWHGQDWVKRKAKLKNNREYWIEKIEENMARDARNNMILSASGWEVIHFWEKEVLKNVNDCANAIIALIPAQGRLNRYLVKITEAQSSLPLVADLVAESIIKYEVSNKTDF